MKKLDIYEQNHNYVTGQFMKLQKTSIGGLFTAIFYILAIALVLSNLFNFLFDNINESKALIPTVIMKEKYKSVTADLQMILKFNQYQGQCTRQQNEQVDFSECHQNIDFQKEGFILDSSKSHWNQIMCMKVEKDCIVKVKCNQCAIQETAYIKFDLTEENSYTSNIQFNVTSTSSIPDEVSSINITISPDPSKLFRGSNPTQLEINAIPSAFETNNPKEQDHDKETGYHIVNTGLYTKGTQFTNTEVQFSANLHAKIVFTLSENFLLTKQTLKVSPVILISAILGSVFGIMGSVRGIMSFVEKQKDKILKKNESQLPSNF